MSVPSSNPTLHYPSTPNASAIQCHSSGRSSSPSRGQVVPHHTPMSERQQLALIKRLELAANTSNGSGTNDSFLVSPPRAPLQVVNGLNPMNTPSTPSGNLSRIIDESQSAHRNQSPTVDKILRKITKRNSKGETVLHTAAIRGSSFLVQQLLIMGANPNVQDNAEWSPLHEACNRGKRSVVKVLLEYGADLNLRGFNKDSPLHDAARNGHLKVVKFLVRSGADIFARNEHGRTPRQEAEVTLTKIESDSIGQTIHFLVEEEKRREEQESSEDLGESHDSAENNNQSESESSEDGSDHDDPDDDVAKLLGVGRSPDVLKAFKALSRSQNSKRMSRSGDLTPVKSIERKLKTTTITSKSQCSNSQSSKLRLNFDTELARSTRSSSRDKEEFDDIGIACIDVNTPKRLAANIVDEVHLKRRKRRRLNNSNDGPQDVNQEIQTPSERNGGVEGQVLKVPPLKIFLQTKESGSVMRFSEPEDSAEQQLLSENQSDPMIATTNATDFLDNVVESKQDETNPHVESSSKEETDPVSAETATSTSYDDGVQFYQLCKKRQLAALKNIDDECNILALHQKVRVRPKNYMEKFIENRALIERRRKNMFPVEPKPPEGFADYLMIKKTYLLQHTSKDLLKSIPKMEPPPSLSGKLRELFLKQEEERFKLRARQLVEREKLVLTVEQEILRVHCRAARFLANQSFPFSFCSYIKDDEVYNIIEEDQAPTAQDEKTRESRTRFNGRVFMAWLRELDDKWDKIKEKMLIRHHHEAEALNACQKMDWEWESGAEEGSIASDDLRIPMVYVSDEFEGVHFR